MSYVRGAWLDEYMSFEAYSTFKKHVLGTHEALEQEYGSLDTEKKQIRWLQAEVAALTKEVHREREHSSKLSAKLAHIAARESQTVRIPREHHAAMVELLAATRSLLRIFGQRGQGIGMFPMVVAKNAVANLETFETHGHDSSADAIHGMMKILEDTGE